MPTLPTLKRQIGKHGHDFSLTQIYRYMAQMTSAGDLLMTVGILTPPGKSGMMSTCCLYGSTNKKVRKDNKTTHPQSTSILFQKSKV
jgi:hypothetical protein